MMKHDGAAAETVHHFDGQENGSPALKNVEKTTVFLHENGW